MKSRYLALSALVTSLLFSICVDAQNPASTTANRVRYQVVDLGTLGRQDKQSQKHHHYQLIDLGTLGGLRAQGDFSTTMELS